jgi:hypothetical protein
MNLITTPFTDTHILKLEEFCKKCEQVGYDNNKSLKAMRLDWCLENGGQFYLTWDNDTVISVSGCHPLPQVGNVYRGLFRGATLPEYQNLSGKLTKTHMNSIPFFYHLPRQITWAKEHSYDTVVVTTNWNNPDGIKSMSKSHSVFKLLEKQGIVKCIKEKIELFYTDQSVWEINVPVYCKVRNEYEERHY